jgi:hypothetical protein
MERSLLPMLIIKMFNHKFWELNPDHFGNNFDDKATDNDATPMYLLIGWQALPSPPTAGCLPQSGSASSDSSFSTALSRLETDTVRSRVE